MKLNMCKDSVELQVLNSFLMAVYPKKYDTFTDKNKLFLLNYSVLKKDTSPNKILAEINEEIQHIEKYNNKFRNVEEASKKLQDIHTKFINMKDRSAKKGYPEPFHNNFVEFLKWWVSTLDKDNGQHRCYYCGVEEKESMAALKYATEKENKLSHVLLGTKRVTWKTGTLQIDKKDPSPIEENDTEEMKVSKGYNADNCVFSCVLCNNAKSDLIPAEQFKSLIAPGIKNYWVKIKEEMDKIKENKQ